MGTRSRTLEDTSTRFIDAENDTYPPPLTNLPTKKVTGTERLVYAFMYMQIGRVRQLLLETHDPTNEEIVDIYDTGYYGNNILGLITQPCFPTNINYANNRDAYERLFFVVLENLPQDSLEKLFILGQGFNVFGNKICGTLFDRLDDKPHMLLALWNYGLKYDVECVDKYKYEPLKNMLRKTINIFGVTKKRYCNEMGVCPLSLQMINRPAILTDGTVYEYDFIGKHLVTKDTNPLTNERLSTKSKSSLISEDISTKTLYLPEENRFMNFSLVRK